MSKLTAKISLSIGTANVNSMYRGEWGHAGKVHFLRQQFLHFRLNWIGLQETRTPEGFSRSEGVFRFCSGANGDQQGVEFWVNASAPYGYVDKEPLLFQPGHFQVLARHARHLLIRVAAPFLDCLVLVGYAPHSGIAAAERQGWWKEVSELVQQFHSGLPLFVCMDANADPGDCDHCCVFSPGFKTTANTAHLRNFLSDFALCLPSTGRALMGLSRIALTMWLCPKHLRRVASSAA